MVLKLLVKNNLVRYENKLFDRLTYIWLTQQDDQFDQFGACGELIAGLHTNWVIIMIRAAS